MYRPVQGIPFNVKFYTITINQTVQDMHAIKEKSYICPGSIPGIMRIRDAFTAI